MNPNLSKPNNDDTPEFIRIMKSRYRTGSHNLMIEKGRMNSIDRNDRLCKCQLEIQTLKHVLLSCPMLNDKRMKYNGIDMESGNNNTDFLLEMERILAVQ